MNVRKFLVGLVVFSIYLNQPLYALTLNKGKNPFTRALYGVGMMLSFPFLYAYAAIRNAGTPLIKAERRLDVLGYMEEIFSNINTRLCPIQKANLLRFITKAKEVAEVHKEVFDYLEPLNETWARLLVQKNQTSKIAIDLIKEKELLERYTVVYKEMCGLRDAFRLKQMIIQEGQRHYTKTAIPQVDKCAIDIYFAQYANDLCNRLSLREGHNKKEDSGLIWGRYFCDKDIVCYCNKLARLEEVLKRSLMTIDVLNKLPIG